MPTASLATELAHHGPSRDAAAAPISPSQARDYCRRFTRRNYENFTVASWLLPAPLRPHFHAVYAYCRWADDLADETDSPAQSLELLNWWESELRDCFAGTARHPVFVALADTISHFDLPIQPFLDLLSAFRQDQYRTRYESLNELLEYCRNSANPVGRLVLGLARCRDDLALQYSDAICTGLQLANFWQDVARDWDRGRIYLPQDCCRAAGYDESMFTRRQFNPAFRRLLAHQVEYAESLLRAGQPLVELVPPALKIDISLFLRGGLAILAAVRRQDYNVWRRRPTVGAWQKARLFAAAWYESRRRPARMVSA